MCVQYVAVIALYLFFLQRNQIEMVKKTQISIKIEHTEFYLKSYFFSMKIFLKSEVDSYY